MRRILEEAIEKAEEDSEAKDRAEALAIALKDQLDSYNNLSSREQARYGFPKKEDSTVDLEALAKEIHDLRQILDRIEKKLRD